MCEFVCLCVCGGVHVSVCGGMSLNFLFLDQERNGDTICTKSNLQTHFEFSSDHIERHPFLNLICLFISQIRLQTLRCTVTKLALQANLGTIHKHTELSSHMDPMLALNS